MKSAAIICEYNPFHSGHEYQIRRLRELFCEPVAIVCIMSGAFTQRGEPAIFEKYVRAEMAISCGADLVVELPAPWSMSRARDFASGGVAIAKRLGVDFLAFGSECGELEQLKLTAQRLASAEFTSAVESARTAESELGAGALRERIYRELYGKSAILSGSNDILALEYLRALDGTGIEPIAIKRIGERYNPTESDTGYASASTIRQAIRRGDTALSDLPEPARIIAEREIKSGRSSDPTLLDGIVTAFLRLTHESMRGRTDVSGGIENRLHESALRSSSLDAIIDGACERNYSKSRLRRIIFASMLGFGEPSEPEFTNLLAASRVGCELLSRVRKSGFVLTKPANFTRLSSFAREQFELNLRAESLAALAFGSEELRCAERLMRLGPIIFNQ